MGGETIGESSWNSQRDQTVPISWFEQATFQLSCRMFLNSKHTTLTLNDNWYGTWASDNPVKTASNRKIYNKGHCADALPDPFSWLALFAISPPRLMADF